MISSKPIALLDANVLYPAPLRDYMLHLANAELYKPKWSKEIQEEWIRNLLLKRKDLSRESLEKTRDAMDSAFPDSNTYNYKAFIPKLILPDENDRHILAAAIKAKADMIVTFNVKDFPTEYLRSYNIEIQHPDNFIIDLINLDKSKALWAFKNQVTSLKNPPKTPDEVLLTLENCGLSKSVVKLRSYISH